MTAATLDVKLTASTAQFHQRMTAASAVVGKMTSATTSAHRGLFLVRSGVEQLATSASGLQGPLGQVTRGLLTIGGGGGVALLAAAAIGVLVLAYKSLFGGLDKLVEKNTALAKSLGGARTVAQQLREGIQELGAEVQKTTFKTVAFLNALPSGVGQLPLLQDLAALHIANKAEAAAAALEQGALGIRQQRIGQMDKSIRQRQQENQLLAASVELTAQLHAAEKLGISTTGRQFALRVALAEITARFAAVQEGATAAQTAGMVAAAREHVLLEQAITDRERQIAALRTEAEVRRHLAGTGPAAQLALSTPMLAVRRGAALKPAQVDETFGLDAFEEKMRRAAAMAGQTLEAFRDEVAQIRDAIAQGLVDVLGATADRLGAIFGGLAQGFRGFGNTLFAIVGQVISNIGRQLIPLGAITAALGKVGLAIKTFVHNPIAAIAAGVALMALGAALAGAAQRSIGGLSETGAGGGGGGGFASPAAGAAAEQRGTATLIVQGDPYWDMSDPRRRDALAKAIEDLRSYGQIRIEWES